MALGPGPPLLGREGLLPGTGCASPLSSVPRSAAVFALPSPTPPSLLPALPGALRGRALSTGPQRALARLLAAGQSRYLASLGSMRRKVKTPRTSMPTPQATEPHQ